MKSTPERVDDEELVGYLEWRSAQDGGEVMDWDEFLASMGDDDDDDDDE